MDFLHRDPTADSIRDGYASTPAGDGFTDRGHDPSVIGRIAFDPAPKGVTFTGIHTIPDLSEAAAKILADRDANVAAKATADEAKLRDWYAGQAIAEAGRFIDATSTPSRFAKMAFDIADCMMAERAKRRAS